MHPQSWTGRGTGCPCRTSAPAGAESLAGKAFCRVCGDLWVQPQGCRGRSPRQNQLKISPFPPGRGSGGWGQKSKLKARQAGDKESKPPAVSRFPQANPVPHPTQPRGCKGQSPLHKKTKNLPLPAGKSALRARVGGISFPFGEGGQQSKLKAGQAGDKEGKPPGGTCSPRPGGEDHLKRRRRVRRIVPSPPVPPLLGCRHCQ